MKKDEPKQPPGTADDSTFQRFERLVRQVIAVPKSKIDEREREWKRRRESS